MGAGDGRGKMLLSRTTQRPDSYKLVWIPNVASRSIKEHKLYGGQVGKISPHLEVHIPFMPAAPPQGAYRVHTQTPGSVAQAVYCTESHNNTLATIQKPITGKQLEKLWSSVVTHATGTLFGHKNE